METRTPELCQWAFNPRTLLPAAIIQVVGRVPAEAYGMDMERACCATLDQWLTFIDTIAVPT
eukprot:2437562-Rhodomonas_salina.1